jgi:hypothetical protein
VSRVVRPLLVAGNDKLSQAILHWDLPASLTCPGKSSLCASKCYALRSRYLFPQVQERLKWCHEMSRRDDFAQLMVKEIRRKGAAFVVRIHCSGDFYDSAYVRKWIEVVRCCPHTRFYAYTRSFRVSSIVPALAELAEMDNMRLWASADSETGYPVDLPPNVKVAWMQVEEDEDVPTVDLVFRDQPLRKDPRTRVSLSLVCPVETPQGKEREVNCGNCVSVRRTA